MGVNSINNNMKEFAKRVDRQILRTNQYVGESFIEKARRTKTYKDNTSNLRNSIGYKAISKDGDVGKFAGGGIGQSEGQGQINRLEATINEDAALIMVAGMSYGAAVEAKGYDVISGSVREAKKQYQRLIKINLRV